MDTAYSTIHKPRRMFVNILSIFVILTMAFPVVGNVSAQEESPWLRAFPDQDFVDGSNWPAGQAVHLDITDQGFDAIANENGDVAFDLAGYDLARGDTLIMSSGDIFVTYTTRQLFVEDISVDTQTISGTVDGQQTIHFWMGDAIDEYVDTDADGNWSVDLSNYEEAVLTPGICGNAEAWGDDASSSSTIIDWCVPEPPPNPHFTVFPEWGFFDGLDWPDGATVSISVEGKSECHLERESWGGFFNGNFPEGCNVEAGDTVTFDDGTTNRWHEVRNLYVTDVDMSENTVTGKADAGETVYVWPHDGWFEPLETIVGGSGVWQVDLDDAGYTIREDSEGRSEIRDAMGNATASDWHVTHPRFTVFPEWEWFDGNDWPNEAMVTITVEGKPECETTKESWGYFFNGNFGEGCDIVIGDTVTFTDGKTVRTHTVRNLAITKVNQEDDTVKGTADAGAEVYVWPHATGQEQLAITSPKGKWAVDFTGIYDLMPGDGGRAEIRDNEGNSTAVDWNISNPRLIAFPAVDQIFGYYWPEGSIVNLNINDEHIAKATVQGAPWDPNDIMAFFDFGGLHDLIAGDVVTLSGHDMEINYTVQNLTVTEVNEIENTVTGTADPFVDVMVYPFDYGDQPLQVTADENGDWFANFDEADIDLIPGMCGRSDIFDEFTNSTTVDWCIPNPTFVAYMPVTIVGYDWPIGDSIDISINDDEYTAQSEVGNADWDPTVVLFELWRDDFTMEAGDHIVMTDESAHISKEVWVTNLAVTDFDLNAGKVFGTYDPAYDLWVWLYDLEGQVPEIDPENGTWIATFAELPPGAWGGGTQWDEDGDGTSIDFQVPVTLNVINTNDVLDDDGFCTLREAIIAANTNSPSGELEGECPAGTDSQTDTIVLAADVTYSLTIDSTNEDGASDGDLDIWDNSAATDLIIVVEGNGKATISQDAAVDDRVLENHGATIQIEGLILTGGSDVEIGGGVHNAGGTLIMNVSNVSGNTANSGGGIFNNTSGTLILAGSTVSGNTANVDGGGLVNGGTLIVDASTFSANSATYGGGALFTYAGTVTIQNGSVFGGDASLGQGNTANYGGGIAVWSGNLNLTDSTISGNSVTWVGGAIRNVIDGTVAVNNSTISGNSAEWDGGGILNEGVMTVATSEVRDNTATFQGGGLGNYEGDLTITASTVSGNSSGDGGGVVNWANSTLTVDASTFTHNKAGGGGGLRNQGTATITNGSQFTGNTVGWIGGAITNDSGGTLLVEGASTISGNSSDGFAGGLYNDSTSTLTVKDSTVAGNVSFYDGGGINNEGTLTVDDSVLSANSSGQGGALYNSGVATFRNGTVVGGTAAEDANLAYDGGGGLFSRGTLTVNDSIVTGNHATNYGGGLFNWIGGMLIIDNTIVSNNSANEGGGLHNKEGSTAIIQNGSIFSGNYAEFSAGGIQNWGTITITDSILRENTSPGQDGDAIANTGPEGSVVSITASCVMGNGDTAVFNVLSNPLAATGNWWGDASGPFHPIDNPYGLGDSVSDYVNFSGWLPTPLDICVP